MHRAVAVEEGDAIAQSEALRLEGTRHLAGAAVMLVPGLALVAVDEHDVVGLLGGMGPDQPGNGVPLLHGSPPPLPGQRSRERQLYAHGRRFFLPRSPAGVRTRAGPRHDRSMRNRANPQRQ